MCVGSLITISDEPDEGGVIRELQELDRLVTGGAALGVNSEEWRGKKAALRGTGADVLFEGQLVVQDHPQVPCRAGGSHSGTIMSAQHLSAPRREAFYCLSNFFLFHDS